MGPGLRMLLGAQRHTGVIPNMWLEVVEIKGGRFTG